MTLKKTIRPSAKLTYNDYPADNGRPQHNGQLTMYIAGKPDTVLVFDYIIRAAKLNVAQETAYPTSSSSE
jgi:hypothetical protein